MHTFTVDWKAFQCYLNQLRDKNPNHGFLRFSTYRKQLTLRDSVNSRHKIKMFVLSHADHSRSFIPILSLQIRCNLKDFHDIDNDKSNAKHFDVSYKTNRKR